MGEENKQLREELTSHPKSEDVIAGFRGTPAYYTKLNDKAVEKIQICWRVAIRYLDEIPGGPIDGFLECYTKE